MFEDLIRPKVKKDVLKSFNITDKRCPYCASIYLYNIDGVFLNSNTYKMTFVCDSCKRSWKVIVDLNLNIVNIEVI